MGSITMMPLLMLLIMGAVQVQRKITPDQLTDVNKKIKLDR